MKKLFFLTIFLLVSLSLSFCTKEVKKNRKVFYEDGTLKEQFTLVYLDDTTAVKEGLYKSFYPSGQKYEEGSYINDLKTGGWTLWYDSDPSVKNMEGEFVDDQMNGVWLFWMSPAIASSVPTELSPDETNQELVDTTVEFVHPEPIKKVTFKNGKLDGLSLSYYPNGQMADSITYLNGELHGLLRYFHPNGQIASEIEYDNSFPITSQKFWDDEGNLINEIKYDN
jgi:antitoxin component YwqK of YwqJK toxin-antitoxin module